MTIMIEADMVEYAQEKGMSDACNGSAYAPPLIPGISTDTDDAYNCAYWHAVAYIMNPPAETGCL